MPDVIKMPEDKRYEGLANIASLFGAILGQAGYNTLNMPREPRGMVSFKPDGVYEYEQAITPSKWEMFVSHLLPGVYPEATKWRMGMREEEARKIADSKNALLSIYKTLLPSSPEYANIFGKMDLTQIEKVAPALLMMYILRNIGNKKAVDTMYFSETP